MTIPRRWKYAICFWGLYALAVFLYPRYRWIDSVWMGASVLAVLALSVHLVVKKTRYGWVNEFILVRPSAIPSG